MLLRVFCLAVAFAVLGARSVEADDADVGRAERHVLDNGLEVIIQRDPHAQWAVVWLSYRVGLRDELDDRGLAHLAEHLSFRGVSKPSGLEKLSLLQRRGGRANAMLTLRHHGAELYSIATSRAAYPDTGVTRLSFYAPPHKAPEVLSQLFVEMTRLREAPLSARELQLAQRTYAVDARAHTGSQLAALLAELFAAGLEPSWIERAQRDIARLSAEDVQSAAQAYLPSTPAVAVVGDYRRALSGLEELGEVHEHSVELPE